MMRSGQDDPELRAHLEGCETCRQDAEIAAWMIELAGLPVDSARLPDPGMLWWKAQLLQRWDAQRRAAEPIEQGQRFQVWVGAAASAALLYWLWPEAQAWIGRLASTDLTVLAPSSPGSLTTLVAVGGLLAAAVAVVAIREMFAE
jgi:hypothetical protein